ncbi:PEP-CTERM system TPR-repeat protein PrsT [Alteromonas pelagimontana]|uniref:PEP-CTERM system TPR-repeat protein PrsT n=1 Tax=Alteromonas pelagimontana TaxID=1858656 RepID=A0A6M4MFP4_9ALTE|nr:XrtA/PEP-CTERM system TPR-repeat protein PrsT [Alteromonas pelagimontana]QJR81991.1 PEP-CTERM system TPR-repeat protein PrsT [Alteromonas pelagimontana]
MENKFVRTSIASLLSLTLLTACGKASVEDQLGDAQQALQAQKYQSAIITLKSTLQDAPDDPRPRALLAKAYFQLGDMESAVITFEKALEQGADINGVAKEYFLALYSSPESGQFVSTLEKYKDSLNPQALATGELIAAILTARRGDSSSKDHIAAAKAAAGAGDGRTNDLSDIIDVYLIQRTASDTKMLNAAVEKHPNDWLVQSLAAELQYALGDLQASLTNYEALLEQKPQFQRLHLNIAEAQIRLNKLDEAKKHVNYILKRYPNQPVANQQLAVIEIAAKDFASANKHIELAMNNGMASPFTSYIAGLTHFRLGNYEQALQNLSKIVNAVPATHPAKQMFVAAKLQAGASQDAYAMLQRNPELVANNTGLAAATSKALLGSGDRDKAKQLLSQIDSSKVTSDAGKQQLGLFKVMSGDISGMALVEEASNALLADASAADTKQSKLLLLSMKTSSGETDAARAMLNKWIADEPDNVENYVIAAEFEKFQQNYKGLDAIYSKIAELDPDNIAAKNYNASKAIGQGNYSKALTLFLDNLKQNPNSADALEGAYQAAAKAKDESAAQAQINDVLKNATDTSTFTTLYSQFLAGNYSQVIKVAEASTFNARETPPANYMLSTAYLQTGQANKAINVLQKIVSSGMTTPQVLLNLAKAQAVAQKPRQALETLAMFNESGSASNAEIYEEVRLLKASILMDQNNYANALQELNAASEQVKASPQGQLLLGRGYLGTGKANEAVNALQQAYSASESGVAVQYLFEALKADGKTDQGLKILKQHMEKYPDKDNTNMLYISELASQNPTEAIRYYEDLLSKQPENWVAMNNVAWLLYEQNSLEKAHSWIKKAAKLKPRNQGILDTKAKIEAKM